MFDISAFESKLATSWLGRSFYFYEELASTNSYAKKMQPKETLHGSLVVTDYQSGGRGQHSRKWIVEPGANLTFTIVAEPPKAERLNLLTLSCALAVQEAIEELTGITGEIKWPNDILVNGKKLCGILTESVFIGNKLDRVVVGIGLNVNQTTFSEDIDKAVTSLRLESGKPVQREELLARIMQRIEFRYRQWAKHSEELVRAVNRLMIGVGDWCSLQVNGEIIEQPYKFLGVSDAGELLALDKKLDVTKYAYEQVRVLRKVSA